MPTSRDTDPSASLSRLEADVLDFCRNRGWLADEDPKSLAISVAIEAAEIMEIFQWKRRSDSLTPQERQALSLECADVFWYLLRLCAAEGIDLAHALREKIEINTIRFAETSEVRGG